jgi:hypothetical protein
LLTDASHRSRLVLVALLAGALFAAGCGGESEEDKKKDYRDGLVDADAKFDRELRDAGAVMRAAGEAKSPAQYQRGAEQLQTAVDDFKEELEELETPEDAEDEQEEVEEAVEGFADSVGRIAAAVQSRNVAAIRAEDATVRARGAEVDRSIEQLKEAVE